MFSSREPVPASLENALDTRDALDLVLLQRRQDFGAKSPDLIQEALLRERPQIHVDHQRFRAGAFRNMDQIIGDLARFAPGELLGVDLTVDVGCRHVPDLFAVEPAMCPIFRDEDNHSRWLAAAERSNLGPAGCRDARAFD